ncbi:hypothetical protein Gpo141_00012723 [Globisporangium polare]
MENDGGGAAQYELVEVHQLPFVSVSRSLKKALLSPGGVKTYKALCKKINLPCTILYTVAFPIGASVLTVPTEYARVLAIFKFLFQVPMLIMTSAGLRVDLLWCLVTTYEFWFFTIQNLLTCIVFSMHLGDLRMIMAPVYWYGIQMNIWADGKVQGPQLASAAALAAVYHVFLLIVFGLQLTPDPHPVELISHGGRSMTSGDYLMNSFTTMMVLMARTAYRKRVLIKSSGDDPKILRFVSYRCRVKFQVKKQRAASNTQSNGPTLELEAKPQGDESPGEALSPDQAETRPAVDPTAALPSAQRLRFVKSSTVFSSSNILAPRLVETMPASAFWRLTLVFGSGALGFSFQLTVFAWIHFGHFGSWDQGALLALMLLALLFTTLFCGAFFACYERQLMRKLLSSFDFLFLSLQITMCLGCICSIIDRDARCIIVLTGWLWLHWMLTLDALTPKMRRFLGFRSCYAIPIMAVSIAMQVISALLIVSQTREDVQTRILWRASVFSYKIVVNSVPFYLSRGFTVFIWSVRILWRLIRSGDDELIMIQGNVEFYGNPKAFAQQTQSAKKPLTRRLSSVLQGNLRIQPEPS